MIGRTRILGALLFTAAVALPACANASADDENADANVGALAAMRTYQFKYVNDDVPYTAAQVKILQSALNWLDSVAQNGGTPLRQRLAQETLARIEGGDVLLGAVASARGYDRFNMCMDFKLPACAGVAPSPDDTTWMGDDALGRTLDSKLLGYQWGNRIYFSIGRSTDPKELAKTLAHEVNHVLNRSECDYYSNIATHEMDGDKAFLQEYRAYATECYFVYDSSATIDRCTTYATNILDSDLYNFTHDLAHIIPAGSARENKTITKLVVDTTTGGPATLGRLIPEKRYWAHSFGACPR